MVRRNHKHRSVSEAKQLCVVKVNDITWAIVGKFWQSTFYLLGFDTRLRSLHASVLTSSLCFPSRHRISGRPTVGNLRTQTMVRVLTEYFDISCDKSSSWHILHYILGAVNKFIHLVLLEILTSITVNVPYYSSRLFYMFLVRSLCKLNSQEVFMTWA